MFAAAIGVSGVTAASAYTLGARRNIDAQFVQLGAELIVVTAKLPIGGLRRLQGARAEITLADYAALERRLSGIRSSATAVLTLRVEAAALSKKTQIVGVEPAYFEMKHWHARDGRLFAAYDNRRLGRVALLGGSVARTLFGGKSPLGASVMIDRVPFTVIGVLAERGQSVDALDEDDEVYVPLQSLMHRLSNRDGYTSLIFDAGTMRRIEPLSRRIGGILAARHHADPTAAFRIQNRQSTIEAQAATFARITALARSAALALYVIAATGILTISRLAVGARTVQIGVMRALGAQREDVLVGFFVEGALPSAIGCVLGWAATALVSRLLATLAGIHLASLPSFSSTVSLLSALIFAALSTAAALRGASMSPTDAMRSA